MKFKEYNSPLHFFFNFYNHTQTLGVDLDERNGWLDHRFDLTVMKHPCDARARVQITGIVVVEVPEDRVVIAIERKSSRVLHTVRLENLEALIHPPAGIEDVVLDEESVAPVVKVRDILARQINFLTKLSGCRAGRNEKIGVGRVTRTARAAHHTTSECFVGTLKSVGANVLHSPEKSGDVCVLTHV
jgi:hypothetical protein